MRLSKPEFRTHCLEKIKSAPRHNKRYKDALIERKVERIVRASGAKSVLFYWPLAFEADMRRLLGRMRRTKKIYLPFMEDVSFKMVPFRYPLKSKQFGIYEPGNTFRRINKIDLVIVPAVGVDAGARRIGFGKGMYDRFFAALDNDPIIIFVQNTPCITKEHICDHYDVAADVLVTPHRCYGKSGIIRNVIKRNTLRRRHCHA